MVSAPDPEAYRLQFTSHSLSPSTASHSEYSEAGLRRMLSLDPILQTEAGSTFQEATGLVRLDTVPWGVAVHFVDRGRVDRSAPSLVMSGTGTLSSVSHWLSENKLSKSGSEFISSIRSRHLALAGFEVGWNVLPCNSGCASGRDGFHKVPHACHQLSPLHIRFPSSFSVLFNLHCGRIESQTKSSLSKRARNLHYLG